MFSDADFSFEQAKIIRLMKAVVSVDTKAFLDRLKWGAAEKRAEDRAAYDSYQREHEALMAIAEAFHRFKTELVAIRRKWRPEPGARDFAL